MKEARDTKDSRSPDNWRRYDCPSLSLCVENDSFFCHRMIYLLTDNPHMDHLAGVLCNWAKVSGYALFPPGLLWSLTPDQLPNGGAID